MRKTTVADLILRCYNVPDGTLFVDGKDVNDITIKSLRNFCAYVPQDNYLFGDTIANNIAFATGKADMRKIIRSAQLADVDDNISGPSTVTTLFWVSMALPFPAVETAYLDCPCVNQRCAHSHFGRLRFRRGYRHGKGNSLQPERKPPW